MADDPNIRGYQDRTRISMIRDDEVRHWIEKFGVTREQLQQAVDQAGPMADSVEWNLRHGSISGAR
jgi:hypothetical protein